MKQIVCGFLAVAAMTVGLCAQEALRVNGANAMWAPLNKNVSQLEMATGSKVAFVPNTAGRGLADLADGSCDIAMVTFSVASAAEGVNQEKPGSVGDLSAFKATEVGAETIVFVVNPANTVSSITLAQAKDILLGKITNWKEVGGSDEAIVVVRLGGTAGPHMVINKDVLAGEKVVESAKMMKAPKDVPKAVGQLPGGIGYIGKGNVTELVKVVSLDQPLTMKMYLVTKGEPTPVQQKFIDTAKSILAK